MYDESDEWRVPDSQFSLTIDLNNVIVNQVIGDPAFLWQPPNLPGVPVVDLGQMGAQPVSVPRMNLRP